MNRTATNTLLLLSCLLLASCGFSLRGTDAMDLPAELQTLYVSSQGNSPLSQALIRALQTSDADIRTQAEAGVPVLALGNEEIEERVISVNSNARAGEYLLIMSTSYSLIQGGATIMGPEQVSLERNYTADPNNAVAKLQEAELIQNEMRRDLSRQIIRQLQALSK